MANYFTYFSFVVKLKTADQKHYALDLARKGASHRFSDEPIPDGFPVAFVDVLEDWAFEAEEDKDGIWLHSESGGIDAVCAFVQYLLRQFDREGRVRFEWSYDCNKPRLNAYGGGAAIITAGEILTMTTSDWIRSQSDVIANIDN